MAERIELDAGKADVGEFDADDYTASASILDSYPPIIFRDISLARGLTHDQYWGYDMGGTATTSRPAWAGGREEFPGIERKDVAPKDVRDRVLARFVSERSTFSRPANLRFVASKSGDLWVKWDRGKWYKLTWSSDPNKFLSASSIERYGLDLARALGVAPDPAKVSAPPRSELAREANEVAQASDDGLDAALDGFIAAITDAAPPSAQTPSAQTASAPTAEAPTAEAQTDAVPTSVKQTQTGAGGLGTRLQALRSIRDEKAALESKKVALKEAIEAFRKKLEGPTTPQDADLYEREIEKAGEELAATQERIDDLNSAIRSQARQIYDTLTSDATLTERVRTLFREQGVTIASILTAIGMAISTLVLALTGAPAPTPPSDKGGIKEWVKKRLQGLGRVLANLASKAAAAGILGSIVAWLLNLLAKTAGWLAGNLWAVVVAVGALLLVAARAWLA